MNPIKRLAFILVALGIWAGQTVHPQELENAFYEEAVQYRDGEISVAFEHVPVAVALNAIEARTGLRIIMPATVENKLINLRLNRVELEPAFRSLMASVGFNSFALMYDADGHPRRAVVLEMQPEKLTGADPQSEDAVSADLPLAAGERQKLQRELQRWSELKQEERGRIEDRLQSLPPSVERERLLREYGRQVLGAKK